MNIVKMFTLSAYREKNRMPTDDDTTADEVVDAPDPDETADEETPEEPAEDAGAVALADATATIESLTASIAEQATEILRLQSVNYALLEQVSAGDNTDDLFAEESDTAPDEDPESVDDALESHRIEED